MLKKLFIILLLAVISFSILTVLANFNLNQQYERDINFLKKQYSLTNNFSMTNPNSISIPGSLRKYIQYSTPGYRNLSTFVELNYSGRYRKEKYGEFYDFEMKSVYNIREEEFVNNWLIKENKIIFNKLSEKLIGDEIAYELKKIGVINEREVYGRSAELFLRSRMIIDAVYFPYYYLASSSIDYKYISGNRTLLELKTNSAKINFIFDFNENGALTSITSDKFNFDGNQVKLSAHYENYIDLNNYKVPASFIVEIENNFDKYVLYEAELDSVNYR